jgi:GntR family transcriptional regulator/MocR family aminotransferase
MKSLFELNLGASTEGPGELSGNLYRQLKSAIVEGRLKPGTKLPPTRDAREAFGVSRNTAADVYDRLLRGGLIVTRHGSGTYVAEMKRPSAPSEGAAEGPDPRLNDVWLAPQVAGAIGFWREQDRRDLPGQDVELRPALIDPALFPFATFRQVMARQLRRMENRPLTFKSPQGNQGNYRLRHAIAEHVSLTRAIACRPDDVLVTSGAQQAFDLIARILVKPGQTTVAIEDPGYPPMRAAFASAGARVAPVPVDAEGIIVEAIPGDASVICVCPSHQFPLGMSMSPRRRCELIDRARARGAVIVEDDYDGEFRYEGSPLEALRSAASSDLVFYVGTFSKSMLPAIRLGFVIPPRWAFPTMLVAKNCVDWHCATPIQLAVAGFISDGHLARHVRRMRRIYRQRRELLMRELQAHFGRWLEPIPSYYGMHVTAMSRGDFDCEAASQALEAEGVMLHSLDRYHAAGSGSQGLVFGYGAADLPALRHGLSVLAAVIKRS